MNLAVYMMQTWDSYVQRLEFSKTTCCMWVLHVSEEFHIGTQHAWRRKTKIQFHEEDCQHHVIDLTWWLDLTSHYSPAFAVLWLMLFSTPCVAPPSCHALLVLDYFQFSSLCVFTSTLSQRSKVETPESFPGSPSCPKLQGPEWRFLWPPGTHPSSGTPSGKHCLASKTAQQHRVNCPHNGGEGHFI